MHSLLQPTTSVYILVVASGDEITAVLTLIEVAQPRSASSAPQQISILQSLGHQITKASRFG